MLGGCAWRLGLNPVGALAPRRAVIARPVVSNSLQFWLAWQRLLRFVWPGVPAPAAALDTRMKGHGSVPVLQDAAASSAVGTVGSLVNTGQLPRWIHGLKGHGSVCRWRRMLRRAMRWARWAGWCTCASCSARWTALARLRPARPAGRRGCSSRSRWRWRSTGAPRSLIPNPMQGLVVPGCHTRVTPGAPCWPRWLWRAAGVCALARVYFAGCELLWHVARSPRRI